MNCSRGWQCTKLYERKCQTLQKEGIVRRNFYRSACLCHTTKSEHFELTRELFQQPKIITCICNSYLQKRLSIILQLQEECLFYYDCQHYTNNMIKSNGLFLAVGSSCDTRISTSSSERSLTNIFLRSQHKELTERFSFTLLQILSILQRVSLTSIIPVNTGCVW